MKTEKSASWNCECENYKCEEFGKESMKTTEKSTGRVVQIVTNCVKNCIQHFKKKERTLRPDEIAWSNPEEK